MEQQKTNLQPVNNGVEPFNFFNMEQFQAMQRIAGMFASSELVPDMYKISDKNPKEKAIANCVIAIDIANRIGANILMVMQNLVIIYGRPSWSSKFLISTINTCGKFNELQYKIEDLGEISNVEYIEYEYANGTKKAVTKKFTEKVRNLRCIAFTTRKGSENVLESPPVTIEMAIKEGWYTKKGSKWPNMPRLMLTYRAASFWNSSYAPELSMGMRTEDEVRDIQEVDFVEIVDQKIAQFANKQHIDIKPEPEQNKATEPESKPELEQKPAQAPEQQKAPETENKQEPEQKKQDETKETPNPSLFPEKPEFM